MTVGSTTFGTQLSNARASAPCLTLFSNSQAAANLGGGCKHYLAGPTSSIMRFTNASGTGTFVFGIPNNPALVGANLYFQGAVFDSAGAFAAVLAASNALRIQVGS
ncbi:MAG: hypothetical protein ACI85K_003108 [Hyphomicrobiaceae bacterium]